MGLFAHSAYSAIQTHVRDAPWLYRYIRRVLAFWLKTAKLKETKDESIYVDVDAIAEAVDVLRGAGLTDMGDPLLCEGTVWLLNHQMKDGSRPVWFMGQNGSKELYDRLHPAWVSAQALRDRDFKLKENYEWESYMQKLLKETNFKCHESMK